MRDYKFRVWDKKKMSYDLNGNPENENLSLNEIFKVLQRRWVVMQFTGILDTSEKEIYEGDIVKVFWDDRFDISEVIFGTEGSFRVPGANECDMSEFDDYEILGNKYENPDLLKTVTKNEYDEKGIRISDTSNKTSPNIPEKNIGFLRRLFGKS